MLTDTLNTICDVSMETPRLIMDVSKDYATICKKNSLHEWLCQYVLTQTMQFLLIKLLHITLVWELCYCVEVMISTF